MIKSKRGAEFVESLKFTKDRLKFYDFTFVSGGVGSAYLITFKRWIKIYYITSVTELNIRFPENAANEMFSIAASGGANSFSFPSLGGLLKVNNQTLVLQAPITTMSINIYSQSSLGATIFAGIGYL